MTVTNAGSTLAANFGGPADLDATQVAAILSHTTFADATTYFSLETTNAPVAAIYGDSLSMAASLLKNSPGTLVLAGANSYTGLTDVQVGALRVTNAAGLGTAAAGTVVANNARLELSGDVTVSGEALTISGQAARLLQRRAKQPERDQYLGRQRHPRGRRNPDRRRSPHADRLRRHRQRRKQLRPAPQADGDATATVVLSGANTYVGDTRSR